jgi:hypothetical protein
MIELGIKHIMSFSGLYFKDEPKWRSVEAPQLIGCPLDGTVDQMQAV